MVLCTARESVPERTVALFPFGPAQVCPHQEPFKTADARGRREV
jgi:hypothetical protein